MELSDSLLLPFFLHPNPFFSENDERSNLMQQFIYYYK